MVSAEKARALIAQYRSLVAASNLCGHVVSVDSPSVISAVRIGGREKRVPNASELARVEKEIERLAEVERWVNGDPVVP
jgi:hypothetical protein